MAEFSSGENSATRSFSWVERANSINLRLGDFAPSQRRLERLEQFVIAFCHSFQSQTPQLSIDVLH